MHSPDRLGIDYLCIAPIDYLWLVLRIDSIRYRFALPPAVAWPPRAPHALCLFRQMKLQSYKYGTTMHGTVRVLRTGTAGTTAVVYSCSVLLASR